MKGAVELERERCTSFGGSRFLPWQLIQPVNRTTGRSKRSSIREGGATGETGGASQASPAGKSSGFIRPPDLGLKMHHLQLASTKKHKITQPQHAILYRVASTVMITQS